MSREALEAWIEATPVKERWGISYHCWALWQAAQADAYERAAKVCDARFMERGDDGLVREALTARSLRDAIRALAKETT